jgi:hypothetical protein
VSYLAHAKSTTPRKPKLTYSCATITRTRYSVRVLDRNNLSESDRRQEAQSTRTPKLVPIQVTLTPVQWTPELKFNPFFNRGPNLLRIVGQPKDFVQFQSSGRQLVQGGIRSFASTNESCTEEEVETVPSTAPANTSTD